MGSKLHFIQVRKKLFDCMYEDSANGLQNIVESIAWNDSIYRTFNEGLRLVQSELKKKRLPNSLIEYIHHAHIAYVIISLRKLYDDKKEGRRAVNSLRTVTQRIVDNAHLFTRENFVTFDGLPYNSQDARDWRIEAMVENRHFQFDSFSGVKKMSSRRNTDRLDVKIPEYLHLHTRLRTEIESFANKFLAHSSSLKNRPNELLTFQNLSLLRIQAQCKNVIWCTQQVARFLSAPFLSVVPTPQFDVLMNWENGLFDDNIKKKLSNYWEVRMRWWQKWTDYYRDGYKVFSSPGFRPRNDHT